MTRQIPIAALLEKMVREGEVPGIQYLVVTKDRSLFQAAAGMRDVATGQPMERSTLQMAYSTTKVVTAVAAMQLVEAGKLGLDRPLDAYFAAHPSGGGVTIRSLLAQTSGVPNPMPATWAVGTKASIGKLLRECKLFIQA
jgi:CubicO group peptidase (beta-lactamase class C family)